MRIFANYLGMIEIYKNESMEENDNNGQMKIIDNKK